MTKRQTYLLGGTAVGVLNGLFGGGGGMVAVPILRAAGKGARTAHATAIAAILPTSVLSGAVYLLRGLVPISLLLPVALGVTVGGLFGAKLLPRVSPNVLTVLFAVFMLAAGIRMML